MTWWYQTTIDAILNTTYSEMRNHRTTINTSTTMEMEDWMYHPVMIILGGDFNHNLTSISSNSSNTTDNMEDPQQQQLGLPYNDWMLVAPSSNDSIIRGTTQKEYNYMGIYDGFLASTKSMMLQLNDPSSFSNISSSNNNENNNKNKNNTLTTLSSNNSTTWTCNVTNVFGSTQGFMPKVVYQFPQEENRVIQTTAQFALISHHKNNNNDTSTPSFWNNITFWNDTMVQEYINNDKNESEWWYSNLTLIFSASSNFTDLNANDITVVPDSHPIHDALSDHSFVSATFTMTTESFAALPSDNNNNGTTSNPTNNTATDTSSTTKSHTFLSQVTPVGRGFVYLVMVFALLLSLRLVWKYCCCRNSSSSSSSSSSLLRQQEFDRVSLTDTPPPIQ
jgi:hypothetical protein